MRSAIVTGAARNIGQSVAGELVRQGWSVLVADVDGDAAVEAARQLGSQAHGVHLDIGSPTSVDAMAVAALERFGRIDALVNNAAKFSELSYRPFDQIPPAEWDAVLHTNLTGTLYCIRACVPEMKKRGWGRIVNVSSGTYRMGRPNFLHYVTSKAGVMGMSRSLARELGPFGITVNTVLPGVVFTDTQKQRLPEDYQRMILAGQCLPVALSPAAIAGPIAFLCSEAAAFITGQELAVDGGLTHGG